MKRLLDIVGSLVGLLLMSPVLFVFIFLIWLQDRHSPFYIATRVGCGKKPFRMAKLRSMVKNADKLGGTSTSGDDNRLTAIGHIIRRYKIDEFSQLFNVLIGHMSLVGPRPNTIQDVSLYTSEEKRLLTIRPGITDISSIVFSDEGEILKGNEDPDLKYNQVIRPYKSRFGLFYLENQGVFLDIQIVFLTVIAIFSRKTALLGVNKLLKRHMKDPMLIEVALRKVELKPYPPPGATRIVSDSYSIPT